LSTEVPTESAFSFRTEDFSVPETPAAAPVATHFIKISDTDTLQRIQRAVEAVGEATYHWTTETDTIQWSPNMEAVLGCKPDVASTGRAYANLLDGDNITSRYDTVMRSHAVDEGDGVAFQIEYLFRPDGRNGRRAIWLEDRGKWFVGKLGRPAEVFGTIRRIDDRHSRDQHLSFLGNCDPLTGLMNRGRLAEALGETISTANREQGNCAFLIAAVNNLPVVNEAYGFEVADEVIVALGRRLRQVVRTGDAIARYSGSKFGIILNNCQEDELQIAVDRFVNIARESVIETEHGPVWAMLSVGAVVVPKYAADANLAMARAEEALAEARRMPSDGSAIYRPSALRVAERQLNARCASAIVKSLKEDQFKLCFQPIVSAATRDLIMHEALLRMTDAEGDLIVAANLIPVAEKLGLVRLIDRAVAQMTISSLHNYPMARLSMNVSGSTATDPRWFNQLTEIIAANRSVANRLTIEITETIALADLKETYSFVESLRNIGCGVAIDDFGVGFTSFRNLRDLPVNIVKLDGSFCRDLKHNSANEYLVRTLIDLTHKFNLKSVAEWVEAPEDAEILEECQVDMMQGNLFGKPVLTLPWAPREDLSFTSEENDDDTAVEIADTTFFTRDMTPSPAPAIDMAEIPGNAEMEEGLSRLKLAIRVLDEHFRSPPPAPPEDGLAQAG
jgi:diguanylate cyclase (GGDEF)-like protein